MAFAPTAESESSSRTDKPDERSGDGAKAFLDLETDPRWLSIQRLIKTESFAKASRLSSFLLYIVERSLRGRTEEITEQQIGVNVFGRPTNYNPGDDNIVRQTARQLRQRLALYYQEEGRNELIQVIIPRGGYIPQFQDVPEQASSMENTTADAASESASAAHPKAVLESLSPAPFAEAQSSQRMNPLVLLGVGVVLGMVMVLLVSYGRDQLLSPRTEKDKLWNVLFTPNQKTLVVPGDAGINMYGNLARTQVDVWEYGSSSYLSKPEAQTPSGFTWSPLASRKYTPISDLKFISALQQLPHANRSRMEVRFARDLKADDLKDANAILLGSPNYDPWIQLFDKNQNFTMAYNGQENTITVFNRRPIAGEQASYKWTESDPKRTGYALISLTDNLGSTGKVLLVEGTTLGGVDAATDFLFHSPQMDTLVRDTLGKSGKPSNFELLLETTLYMGDSEKATVVAERIHSSQ